MNDEKILSEIRAVFPKAEKAVNYYAAQNERLTREYGFSPTNTRFAEGGCCDEVNEPEYRFLADHWGERFKFGGLAGYCHAGRTGLGAVSHHVPEENGKRNLLLVCGPHIGYHEGKWGRLPRIGQREITTACGALIAALNAGPDALREKPVDPLDLQQMKVEQIVLDYFDSTSQISVPGATLFLNEVLNKDLFTLIDELSSTDRSR